MIKIKVAQYANKGNGNICTRELGGQWMDASGWLAL
jgi:hypothetical protein